MTGLDRSPRTMAAALGPMLRQAFGPVAPAPKRSTFDLRMAELCARIDRIGGDRQGRPFRHQITDR